MDINSATGDVGQTAPSKILEGVKVGEIKAAPGISIVKDFGNVVSDNSVEFETIDVPKFKNYVWRRREGKFESIFDVVQTPKGKQVVIIPSNKFKIGKFSNLPEFSLALIDLVMLMDNYYRSVSSDVEEEVAATLSQQTKGTDQGIQLWQRARDSKWIDSGFTTSILGIFKGLSNSTNDTPDVEINDAVLGIKTFQTPIRGKVRAVCTLFGRERELMRVMEDRYISEYAIPPKQYMEYRRIMGQAIGLRAYEDVVNVQGKFRHASLVFTPSYRGNHNYEMFCDLFEPAKIYFGRIIAADVRSYAQELLKYDTTSYAASLNNSLGTSVGRSSLLKTAVKAFVSSVNPELFVNICTVMLTNRWNRLSIGTVSRDGDIAITVGFILIRFMTPMKLWVTGDIRFMEVYLIVNFLSGLDRKMTMPHMYVFDWWTNGAGSNIQRPMDYYFNLVQLDPAIDNVTRSLFITNDFGDGFMGCGENPNNLKNVEDIVKFYTIHRSIEPIAGLGYQSSQYPQTPLISTRVVGFLSAYESFSRGFAFKNDVVSGTIAVIKDMMRSPNKITYYAQILEKVNYFYGQTVLAGQVSDDITQIPTLFKPDVSFLSVFDQERSDMLNNLIFNSNVMGQYKVVSIKPAAFHGLFKAFDWEGILENAPALRPRIETLEMGLGVNRDLNELVRLLVIHISGMSDDYTPSQKIKMAVSKWDSPIKSMVEEYMKEKGSTAYPMFDGANYYVKNFDIIKQFILADTKWFGFLNHFYYTVNSHVNLIAGLGGNQNNPIFRFANVMDKDQNVDKTFEEGDIRGSRLGSSVQAVLGYNKLVRINVPVRIMDISSSDSTLNSDYKAQINQQILEFADTRTGYKLSEYEYSYSLVDTNYVDNAYRTVNGLACMVDEIPIIEFTQDNLDDVVGVYEVFNDNVLFDYPELNWFNVGMSSVSNETFPFSTQITK